MGGACRTHGEYVKFMQEFCRKSWREETIRKT